jgi:nitroreductase
MTVETAIQTRKSIRAYQDTPIPASDIESVLEAGRLAPSAGNEQGVEITLVTDKTLRIAIANACEQDFVSQASAILVVTYTNTRDMMCQQPARTIDAAITMSFLILRATELGLGTCWIGHFHSDVVHDLLRIPPDHVVAALTPIGYPAQEGRERDRKSGKEIFHYNRWDDPSGK